MTLSRRWAALGILALLALQWLWHVYLLPPVRAPAIVVAFVFSLPILPAAWLTVVGHRQASYWGGVASLFYFCHAIAEMWSDPAAWPLGLTEMGLALWVIFAGNWAGLRAKLFRRPE
jgi:uncharacterized membrane protein